LFQIRAGGFVLYREQADRILYLLLESARHGDWGAPKGKADGSEEAKDTALRETREETGIERSALAVDAHFRRSVTYPVSKGDKQVVYFLASTHQADVRLSGEHRSFVWAPLDEALATLRHENLRRVFADAAVYVKDPALRSGLDPAAARALLESKVGAGSPVVAHSAHVAAMSRALAEAWGGLDADYVEAAGWLHDIGRSRTHGNRHPLEGFRLLVEEGLGGYAPPCLSHYTKGLSAAELELDPELAREMWAACALDTLCDEEKVIALADYLAVGDRRGRLDERYRDLVRRYGPSAFVDSVYAAAQGLRREFESRTGRPLYELVGILEPEG
jgi:putative nucleotidyltransferase with HDIG domain